MNNILHVVQPTIRSILCVHDSCVHWSESPDHCKLANEWAWQRSWTPRSLMEEPLTTVDKDLWFINDPSLPCFHCISGVLHGFFLSSYDLGHAHSFTMVRALQPANASPDWKLPIVPEMEPLQRQSSSFVLKRREMVQLTKAFLQPTQTATTYTTCNDYASPLPPIPHFLLAQNLSLKTPSPNSQAFHSLPCSHCTSASVIRELSGGWQLRQARLFTDSRGWHSLV